MKPPRVLLLLGTDGEWARGILRGFMAIAQERDWALLHYPPCANLTWLMQAQVPDAVMIGPEISVTECAHLAPAPIVSVTVDRSTDGIASVCPDEAGIGVMAAAHLLASGLRHVTTFRYDESAFSIARESAFLEHARRAGAEAWPGWGGDGYSPSDREENPDKMMAWLRELPKPCGIFTCTDGWARPVARYAQQAGLRVPEDLALVGAGNDALECELISPPLSSVLIPWQELGRKAAALVDLALKNQPIAGKRSVVSPLDVVARRSSDAWAVQDPLVATAVRWIAAHAGRRITVPMVARAVGGGRQRLERRFRRALKRTIQEEIRRAHVELAKRLLTSLRVSLAEIARQSGFSSASLLNVAFQRELGMSPGTYRRRLSKEEGASKGS